jgi:hypothetical protein
LYAITLTSLLLLAAAGLMRAPRRARRIYIAFVAVLPMLLLVLAGSFFGFRVLGRHCTPFLPVLLFILSLGLVSACSGKVIFKVLAAAFLLLTLVSCLLIRFAPRHEKDDYRDAAKAANIAISLGHTVWWSASGDGASYYHLPLAARLGEEGRALPLLNPTPELLSTLPVPDLVIMTSRLDLYDNRGALVNYIRNNPYTIVGSFPAFVLWQRKTNSPPP